MPRTDGPNGKLTEYSIKYTFGFDPLQQYLIEFPGGRFQTLDIASTFSEQIKLVNLAKWGEIVTNCKDVLSAMQFASQNNQVLMSQESSGYLINGKTSIYWQRLVDAPTSGRDQADFISFALALNGMRLAAGPDWAPL